MRVFQKYGRLWVSLLAFMTIGFAAYQDGIFYQTHHVCISPTLATPTPPRKHDPKVLLIGSAFTFGEVEWQSRLHRALAAQGHCATSLLIII